MYTSKRKQAIAHIDIIKTKLALYKNGSLATCQHPNISSGI